MSSSSANTVYPRGTIRIGVETEFYLRLKRSPPQGLNRIAFAKDLVSVYNDTLRKEKSAHPSAYTVEITEFTPDDYSRWCLTDDYTIKQVYHDPQGGVFYGFELITPVLTINEKEEWIRTLDVMHRKYIPGRYEVTADSLCATHVHISKVGGYTLPELQNIASSILHFEMAFWAMMPEEYRWTIYSKSHLMDNHAYSKHETGYEDMTQAIRNTDSVLALVALMNPHLDRSFAWNFLYLTKNNFHNDHVGKTVDQLEEYPEGRIEFRQAPATTKMQEIVIWIELVVAFIAAAIASGDKETLATTPQSTGALKRFITTGFTKYHAERGLKSSAQILCKNSPLSQFFDGRDDEDALEMVMTKDESIPANKDLEQKLLKQAKKRYDVAVAATRK